MCAGDEFKVINLIYLTQSPISWATHVFEVERNKQRYILKDAWIEKCHPVSEVEHLKTIAGIEGVPKFICAEDIPGLSMGNLHLGIHSNKNGEWIRHQIVTSSCGSHIASFHSN